MKLLRPGIHRRMQADTTLFYALASLLELMAPNLRRLKLVTAVDQFTQISDMELDLRLEAAAAGKKLKSGPLAPHNLDLLYEINSRDVELYYYIRGLHDRRGAFGGASLRIQAFIAHFVAPALVTASPACSVRVSSLPSSV